MLHTSVGRLLLLAVGIGVALMVPALVGQQRKQRQHDDECRRVDDELADSFPASDPPSHSSPIGAQAG